jgi:hypothetical protein
MPENGRLADLDLSAVGNVARAPKAAMAQPQTITHFSVKKGDEGGVLVCEYYDKHTPPGRRDSSFRGGKDYKESPFAADDGEAALSHIEGLLGQMGVSPGGEAPPEMDEEPTGSPVVAPPLPARQPRPPLVAAAKGPGGGGVAVRRPIV